MSEPPKPSAWINKALLIVFGLILLLPGACAGFYIVQFSTSWPSAARADYFLWFILLSVWLGCFVISALGISLIMRARK